MSNVSRGRCVPCNIVWTWTRGRRTVARTKCPECGLALAPTSQNVIAPTREYHEPKRGVLMEPSKASMRALEFLCHGELEHRLGRLDRNWVGAGSFVVAYSTVSILAKAGLARIVRENAVKRCRITERGRECVSKFNG